MNPAFVVRVPFTRLDPVTGQPRMYQKGEMIAHPDRVADIDASDHEHHVNRTVLGDDHHAVMEAQAEMAAAAEVAQPAARRRQRADAPADGAVN